MTIVKPQIEKSQDSKYIVVHVLSIRLKCRLGLPFFRDIKGDGGRIFVPLEKGFEFFKENRNGLRKGPFTLMGPTESN